MNITRHVISGIGLAFLMAGCVAEKTKTVAVAPYQKPDASFYDRSPLSGIKDYAAFKKDKNVVGLASKGVTEYVIHVAAKATPAEQWAAKTLSDYLQQITKAEFKVVTTLPDPKSAIIAVGPDAAKNLLPSLPLDLASLGHDGIVMRTMDKNLILSGAAGSRRGTVYAVVTFLENIGCRWWTELETFVPQKPTLKVPQYDVRYRPALEYRELYSYLMNNFAVYNKLNGNVYKIPEDRGGKIGYQGPYFVHTFDLIVPRKEYFAQHPEWFAELSGKRSDKYHQLCLSSKNKDLLELVIGKVKGYLANAPPDSIVSVSQNDDNERCQCSDCIAIEKEEDSPAGPILRFVNAIAAAIEKEYPQAKIDTLAYTYSQKPPSLTKPRANVQIRVCAFHGCRWLTPYDSKASEAFFTDFIGWGKLTSNIYVWDYTTDFSNYIHPFPNLYVTSANIRLFVRNRVKGIMQQGTFNTPGGDMADLKHWVFAKLLWDPSLDEKKLIREFVVGYYGEASPYVAKYLELLYAGDPMQQAYLRLAFLEKAYALFIAGRAQVKNDAATLRKFELAFTPTLNAIMMHWPLLKQECAGKPWPFPETPAVIADEFVHICDENKVTRTTEAGVTPAQWAEQYRVAKKTGKEAAEFKDIAAGDKMEIQDDMFRFWHKGEGVFIVADENASDGSAASMPSTHAEWAVQADLPVMPAKAGASGKWKVYAAVKIIKKGNSGNGFSAGVYDMVERKNVAGFSLSDLAKLDNEDYHFYLIGSVVPGSKYIYVAPTNNPDNVKAILVDRFMLIRDE